MENKILLIEIFLFGNRTEHKHLRVKGGSLVAQRVDYSTSVRIEGLVAVAVALAFKFCLTHF